jgi:ribosomal protein S18 acetylase RimI-like enzyme
MAILTWGGTMIRRARPDEATWALETVRAAFQLYVPRMGREPGPMRRDYAQPIAQGLLYVREHEGRPVGLMEIGLEPGALGVKRLAVAPSEQGRGHGRALLDYAESEARRLGLPFIRLVTNAAMTENFGLYRHLGFHETHRDAEGYVHFEKSVAVARSTHAPPTSSG